MRLTKRSITGIAAAFIVIASAVPAAPVRGRVARAADVPSAPRRIVSLAPNITETLFALGLGDRVAGVTDQCEWPPEAATKARVGGVVNPSLERIVALEPDLVFATAGGNRAEDVTRLAELGIAVYTIDTRSVHDILLSLNAIGTLAGRPDEARELVARLELRRDGVIACVAGAPPVAVFVALERSPLISAAGGTFVDELVRLAGGRNIVGGSTVKYPVFSLERLLVEDPEVILDAADPRPAGTESVRASWRAIPGASHLAAVRRGRLVSVGQGTFFRPGPRIMDSLETLAAILHPSRCQAARPGGGRDSR